MKLADEEGPHNVGGIDSEINRDEIIEKISREMNDPLAQQSAAKGGDIDDKKKQGNIRQSKDKITINGVCRVYDVGAVCLFVDFRIERGIG